MSRICFLPHRDGPINTLLNIDKNKEIKGILFVLLFPPLPSPLTFLKILSKILVEVLKMKTRFLSNH